MKKLMFLVVATANLALAALAQNTFIDTVTIRAPRPNASEAGPTPGLFEILRSGPTNYALRVFYQISGSASNGADYATIATGAVIPEGSRSVSIPVNPIDDAVVEGDETVVVQIVDSPLLCPAPECGYYIGWPSNAMVTIADNDTKPPTNQPPVVRLISPRRGEQFIAPADIALAAYAQDPEDGYRVKVEFFEGDHSLGFASFLATVCPATSCPNYGLIWSNVPAGNYTITARVTDQVGATSVSDPADISVLDGVNIYATDPTASEQPATTANAPDTATFTVQRSGDTGESIVVYYAIGGTASNGVDYEKLSGEVTIPQGARSAQIVVTAIDDNLVEGTESVELTLLAPCPQCLWATPPCEVPEGTNCYPLGPRQRAIAYILDNDRPPATNPPIVTIVATDPIAVEGSSCPTNWWWTTPTADGGWTTNSTTGSIRTCPGTNTALFMVCRSGETNSDLTVYYTIGGTASNGVDYSTLPNRVTIPAGEYCARVEVIPIDDRIVEQVESVVLTLTAPTNPFAYRLGVPRRAAAIIVDNEQPRPPCGRLPDGLFHLCAPGTNGYTFCIRTSADLTNWSAVCTNTVTEGAIHFVDPDAPELTRRFYMICPESRNAPTQ